MVIIIQNISDEVEANKLIKIVEKQMIFIGSKHDREKIDCAIKNTLKNERTVFFVKVNEKEDFIGFAFANICSGLETGADYLWINELYVEPAYRRSRVATEIFEFVEKWANDNNIKYIAAMTDTNNKGAIAFYKSKKYTLDKVMWVDKLLSSK